MADFHQAFDATILAEGGFKLTNIQGDRGGQTYAGIARKKNPSWSGWEYIDRGDTPPTELVRVFYKEKFWDFFQGDLLADQSIAADIFDFGVNTGQEVSAKLAQIVVGAVPDGKFGPKTIGLLNKANAHLFSLAFAIAKLARYRDIVTRDKSQSKFLLGWINRILNGVH